MGIVLKLRSPLPTAKNCHICDSWSSSIATRFPTTHRYKFSTNFNDNYIGCSSTSPRPSKFGNFLDLKPDLKPEFLDILEVPWHDHHHSRSDVIVVGAGPAGLRLAEQVSSYGIDVCVVDPSPLSTWRNNYAVWADEFEAMNLQHCLDKTWPTASVYLHDNNTRRLGRPYSRVNRNKLKTELVQRCISNGVKFHKAKVSKIEHNHKDYFESTIFCDDGNQIKASLVVDASGVSSCFVEYDKPRTSHGYQIAHGILAEVESHPFDLNDMVFMDWRDSHLGNEPNLRFNNSRTPTFLYAMPFDSNLIFLEETSLVCRPAVSYAEVKERMAARLRYLGISVKRIVEEEKCFTLIGGPLPRIPQSVLAIGGSSGEIQPATGFMLARTMALAPAVAGAIAECLGSVRLVRGRPLYAKVWNSLWPLNRRCEREAYAFGMETLLRLDLNGIRRMFDTFFDLDSEYYYGFLSSSLTLGELTSFAAAVLTRASVPTKFDIATKCPPLLVRMIGNIALENIRN